MLRFVAIVFLFLTLFKIRGNAARFEHVDSSYDILKSSSQEFSTSRKISNPRNSLAANILSPVDCPIESPEWNGGSCEFKNVANQIVFAQFPKNCFKCLLNFFDIPRKIGLWSEVLSRESFGDQRAVDSEVIFFLDLDKCAFFGNDANDLGVAMQWMDKSYDELVSLYRLLLNPSLAMTYQILKQTHESVRVVIYTMRADFLFYHSICRPAIVPIHWRPEWHHDGQVYFPPDLASADQMVDASRQDGLTELDADDLHGLSKSLERLLVARQVVAEAHSHPVCLSL